MEVCDEYISKLQVLNSGGFLDSAEQVWNLDETAFQTSELFDKVVGIKGLKQIPSQYNGNAKECVTVLPCGNAAGLQLKFLALYAGKLHLQSRLEDTHSMCYQAVNESGYMDQLIFANYIKKVVFPAMTSMKVSSDTGAHDVIFDTMVKLLYLWRHTSHDKNERFVSYLAFVLTECDIGSLQPHK